MDPHAFDDLLRRVATTRLTRLRLVRATLAGAAGTVLGTTSRAIHAQA
jgi:hypothetical protein